MKLYYYEHPNFGDALNPFLWQNLLPNVFDQDARTLFIGTGTLLNNGVPKKPRKFVFGTGAGYGSDLPTVDANWTFYWVRGPMTVRALGLEETVGISDGALLLRTLELPPVTPTNQVAFMPHWRSLAFWNWEQVCQSLGITYIHPCAPVPDVLCEIRKSKLLITEALHGAIVADAFRVPWVPVRAYRTVLGFKWQDWCSSLNVPYEPVRLPPLYSPSSIAEKLQKKQSHRDSLTKLVTLPASLLNAILLARAKKQIRHIQANPPTRLSDEKNLMRAIERMQEQLVRFQREGVPG